MVRRITTILLGSISVLALTAPAFADDQNAVETVVVTAEKRTEAAKDVPMSISVVGQAELEKLNIHDFDDLAAQVPGLSVTESDPTHPDVILQGINAGGDGSTVGTYLDETPYGSSNALANGSITAPNLDTFDMQRVEVLRGPQGTLYGASSEGGLIKFVTNAPDPTGFDDEIELGGFNLDHGGYGESFKAMVNIPLADNLALRVVGFDTRTPGYIDNPYIGQNHTNDLTNFGGRASLLYKPIDKLSIRFNVMQQQLDAGDADTENLTLAPGGTFYPTYGNYKQQATTIQPDGVRYYIYNTTINWDLDFATLTSSTSYNDLHDFSFTDATALYGADLYGALHQGKFVEELRLASDPGQGPLDWLAGVYFANEHDALFQEFQESFHGTVPSLGYPSSTLLLSSKYIETAGFANATYHVTQSFDVSFGARYAHNSQSAYEDELGALFESGTSSGDVFTWSTDARYHFDDQTMAYVRVATGFRPGGPNLLPLGAPNAVPAQYGSDSLTNYEVGLKGDLFDGALTYDADAFYIDWQNIQLLVDIDNTGVNTNGGGASSKGFEGNVTWRPVDRLTLGLNGAYTEADLTDNTNALEVGGYKGNALPFTPKWSMTLNGDYQLPSFGAYTPFVGASWHYTGSRESDFVGQLIELEGLVPAGVYEPQYKLASYNTFDLRLGVDYKDWSLELYAKNLNEAKGIMAFSPYSATVASGLAPTGAIMPPRLVGIVLRGKI